MTFGNNCSSRWHFLLLHWTGTQRWATSDGDSLQAVPLPRAELTEFLAMEN